jgi:hypothetical protein
MQAEAEVQVAGAVSSPAVQVATPHWVPTAYLRQAPLPSHMPSRPQVDASAMVHCSSGSVPAIALVQLPAALAQVRQVPEQVVAQQVPWAQIPELHSPPAAQVDPFGLLPQLVPTQMLGEAQSPVTVQVVLQTLLVASQPKGSQSDVVTVRQTPAPSHVRGGVSVDPTQLPAAHVVPFA